MAVAKTLSNYKSLTFGGANSRNYGVYITGEGVFNAPERNIEMIDIPGRNGSFALDHGNFNNIEVKYPAGIFADSSTDFATAISDFRNILCSKDGYVRLTDEYNPNEYRLAIYKSGLEVEHEGLINGEFEIVFDCKPQRYLTSGETKLTVANNSTVTNPTLFASSPMLEVVGYGTVSLGGQEIVIHNEPIGDVVLFNHADYRGYTTKSVTFATQYANNGDAIDVDHVVAHRTWYVDSGTVSYGGLNNKYVPLRIGTNSVTFTYGTSGTETATQSYEITSSAYGILTGSITLTLTYNGSNKITATVTQTLPSHMSQGSDLNDRIIEYGNGILHSTQTLLGNPLYIDLDIGEAYKIENNVSVSVNNGVEIPAELPTLKAGSNTITFDNTITSLKITPRWWKV